jgi:hypothetical protein
MRGLLQYKFRRGGSLRCSPGDGEPVRTGSYVAAQPQSGPKVQAESDVQPVRTGSSALPVASPDWHSPAEHAAALLNWMQRPGGRVGLVAARELMDAHREMCLELFWDPVPWIPVAKAFRHLINDYDRHYASKDARRILVYRVPKPTPTLTVIRI